MARRPSQTDDVTDAPAATVDRPPTTRKKRRSTKTKVDPDASANDVSGPVSGATASARGARSGEASAASTVESKPSRSRGSTKKAVEEPVSSGLDAATEAAIAEDAEAEAAGATSDSDAALNELLDEVESEVVDAVERGETEEASEAGSDKEASGNAAAKAAPEAAPAESPLRLARGSRRRDEAAEAELMQLWRDYKERPTELLRNRLMETYMHIVRFSAERMHARLPGEVDVNDLAQAGHFGLMDAIDAFDLERGVKFETFCTQRIRGAIFDELRAMDWVPRLVRARTARVEKARKQLEAEFGRSPTDDELCQRLGVDQGEFNKIIRDSSPVGLVSLDRKWFETDSSKDVREIDVIKDTKQESPVQELQRGDLKHLVTRGLTRAERLIVVLYYYEGMTMKEIGTTLDLSESRVSQMHSLIIERLKAQMRHRDKDV